MGLFGRPGHRHIIRWLVIAEILEAVLATAEERYRQLTRPEKEEGRETMEQLFGPKATTIFRAAIIAALLGAVGGLVIIDLAPRSGWVTGVNAYIKQDVPFSHEHHAGEIGIDCRFCHQYAATGSFAGIPQTQTCMKCHRVLFKDAPMLAAVRKSFSTGKPLTWNRVYRLPDFVYFDHSIHLAAGVSCETCHADVRAMPWIRRADGFFMRRCLACHRQANTYATTAAAGPRNGLSDCSTCHR